MRHLNSDATIRRAGSGQICRGLFIVVLRYCFSAAPREPATWSFDAICRMRGTTDPKQTLDVYGAADAKHKKRPVVVWIHGGGWTGGDKREMAAKPTAFVEHGYVFVSTNYRLFPGASIATIARDVAKAIRWTHDHAAEFGGDGDKIFVMGHSAGSQLACAGLHRRATVGG